MALKAEMRLRGGLRGSKWLREGPVNVGGRGGSYSANNNKNMGEESGSGSMKDGGVSKEAAIVGTIIQQIGQVATNSLVAGTGACSKLGPSQPNANEPMYVHASHAEKKRRLDEITRDSLLGSVATNEEIPTTQINHFLCREQ